MTEQEALVTAYRTLLGGASGDPIVRLPLLTGSMVPTLVPGDCLAVRPCAGDQVHCGDVAVFLREGRLTAHRVLFVVTWNKARWLVEKGDLNPDASLVPAASVVGRVSGFERGGASYPYRRALDAATWRQRWDWLLRLISGPYYFRWKRNHAGI